jgi:hypothetical protein
VSLFRKLLADLTGEIVRVWEESFSIPLVGGIAEHEALISSTEIVSRLFMVSMDSLGDVGVLGLNVDQNVHVLAVQAFVIAVVTDSLADVSGDLLEVYLRSSACNFSKKAYLYQNEMSK